MVCGGRFGKAAPGFDVAIPLIVASNSDAVANQQCRGRSTGAACALKLEIGENDAAQLDGGFFPPPKRVHVTDRRPCAGNGAEAASGLPSQLAAFAVSRHREAGYSPTSLFFD